MYNLHFTYDPDDPLAFEVFIGPNDRLPPSLDDLLNHPDAELIEGLARACEAIYKSASSVQDADGKTACLLCQIAIKRDAAMNGLKWFDGKLQSAIELLGSWVPADQVGIGGYVGHLTLAVRQWFNVTREFVPCWIARQRLAGRLGAPVPEYEGHLSASARQTASTKVAYNILPIPPVDELIGSILELSRGFGLRYFGPYPEISLDPLPDEEKSKKPEREDRELCEFLMAQAAILAGAPDPNDPEGARIFLFFKLRPPGALWLLDLRLVVANLLTRLKKMNALSRPPEPALPTPAPELTPPPPAPEGPSPAPAEFPPPGSAEPAQPTEASAGLPTASVTPPPASPREEPESPEESAAPSSGRKKGPGRPPFEDSDRILPGYERLLERLGHSPTIAEVAAEAYKEYGEAPPQTRKKLHDRVEKALDRAKRPVSLKSS
jgi:hypothetical protein